MIGFLILLFLAGVGLTAYGIWEQKTVYSDQNFAVGRVVGYQNARSSGPARVMQAVADARHPIVLVTMESGEQRQIKLHDQIIYGAGIGQKFPELQIGGEISVTYFGQNPKEAFLTDHPLAQTPVKTSTFLMIGLALIGTVIVTLLGWLWLANY